MWKDHDTEIMRTTMIKYDSISRVYIHFDKVSHPLLLKIPKKKTLFRSIFSVFLTSEVVINREFNAIQTVFQ